MTRADDIAIVFGSGGAIGGAVAAALVASGRYRAVHAGARGGTDSAITGTVPFRFDLLDEASIANAMTQIDGTPALVFIATGMLHDDAHGIGPEKSWRGIDAAAMARLFAINAVGPALIAKHCLPRLPRDRRAVFAALSAKVGSIGDNRLGGWHSYRASKAALNMLVRNFAIELARTHPHAVAAALHPGTVDSRLSAPFQRGVAADRLMSPAQSAGHLLAVIDGLSAADSGGLFAWDGQRLPY